MRDEQQRGGLDQLGGFVPNSGAAGGVYNMQQQPSPNRAWGFSFPGCLASRAQHQVSGESGVVNGGFGEG